jgi:hypothetical protein
VSVDNGKLICSATTGKLLCSPDTGKLLYGIEAPTDIEWIKISASDYPFGMMQPFQVGDLWQGSAPPPYTSYVPTSFVNPLILYSASRTVSGTTGWEVQSWPFGLPPGKWLEGPDDGSLLGVWYEWDVLSGLKSVPNVTVTFIQGP